MARPPEAGDGRRRWRPWGLLVLGAVLVTFGVSEALGTQGRLAKSTLQDLGPAPAGETGPADAGGGGHSPSGGSSDPVPADPDSDDTPGDGFADDQPDDPDPTPPPPPPPPPLPPPFPPPPSPDPPSRPLLVSNDRGKALFSLPSLGAGRAKTRCVTVRYRGPGAARVHLFASRFGTGLDRYLELTVTRGTTRATRAGTCKGFRPDTQDYVGAGRGVLFRGRLTAFPKTAEAAALRPGSGPWRDGESHTYRFRVAIVSTNAAQGRSASFDLVWQARS